LYGTLASLSLGVAVVIALLRRRALELYLLTAVLVPFLVLSFYVKVRHFYYFGAWQPPLILLLAIVAGKLAQQGSTRRQEIIGVIFAVLLLAPFAYLGAEAVQTVSQVQPGSDAVIAEYLKDPGHNQGLILVQGGRIKQYLPEARVINNPQDAQGEEIEVVIINNSDSPKVTAPRDKRNKNYLETNKDKFELSYTRGDLEVYVRKPDD
jgi:hypothetical protein